MEYVCKNHGVLTLEDLRALTPTTVLFLGEGEWVPGVPYPMPYRIQVKTLLSAVTAAQRCLPWEFNALSEYNEYHCTEVVKWSEVSGEYVGKFDSPSAFARHFLVISYGEAAADMYDDYRGVLEAEVMEAAYEGYDIFYHDEHTTFVFEKL